MSTVASNPEQMAQLKATFDRESQNLQELVGAISAALADTYWLGPFAERFRSEWSMTYEAQLKKISDELQQLGAQVEMKRQQFEQAGG